MFKKLDIVFVPCLDFDMIKKLANFFGDNSVEKIYQVAGRHKKIVCIFVEHKLFHHSKRSRTIVLKTTTIVSFKSQRGDHQIEQLGRQLKRAEFILPVIRFFYFLNDVDMLFSWIKLFCFAWGRVFVQGNYWNFSVTNIWWVILDHHKSLSARLSAKFVWSVLIVLSRQSGRALSLSCFCLKKSTFITMTIICCWQNGLEKAVCVDSRLWSGTNKAA